MSLRFIYGESGTGKTSLCFELIKQFDTKQKIYIITPEQFSFSAEKKLMEVLDKKAVMNIEVITFERMAYRILSQVGGVTPNTITNCGKAMLLANIIEKEKEQLTLLGKNNKNLEVIMRMITELKKNRVTEDMLKDTTNQVEDKYLQYKLQDIYLLYSSFQRMTENRYLDEDDLLTIVKDKLKNSYLFQDAIIFIDEFVGFTKQEYSMIEELMKIAKQINITICTDSLEKQTNGKQGELFYANQHTALKLKEIAQKNHILIEEPIELKNKYRFKNKELLHLAENLYNTHPTKYEKNCNDIHLMLASNRYSEIENVANHIIELVREDNYAYKDISIITKETEEYASLIKAIFRKYEIPVFIDEKKDLSQNILIQFVLSILEVFEKNWKLESVLNYIKTGSFLLDIQDMELYLFENYCKKYGITGVKKLTNEWTITTSESENIEMLNSIRVRVVAPLLKLKGEIGKKKTVKEITQSLYHFLEENQIQERLLNKMNTFYQEGKIELRNIYQTSWEVFVNVLDELVSILGEEKISFENYTQLLKVGFQFSSLGKIPATLDEVIVGDVDRTRNAKKKVIFIVGLNDGSFPSINKNEGFINDAERETLKEQGVELAKTTKEQIYDENFNIYKAFTVAEEEIFLSYVALDNDGRGLRKSILINKIKKIFPYLKEESDIIQSKTYIASKEITFDMLLINLRKYANGEKIDPIWLELYQLYAQDEYYQKKLANAITGFYYTNLPEKINQENLEKLYSNTIQTSISKLESYRRCPFSYYLKYALKLSDKTELKLEKVDTGSFMHDIIHEFFEEIRLNNQDIKEISEEEIENIIEEIIQTKLAIKQNYLFNSIPKYVILTKRLKKVIITAIKYIVDTLKLSDFKVLGTEVEFGKGKYYEPIELELENNKKIEIVGKIDRIDIAENDEGNYIRIIDYKSSVKNIDLNEVVAGIQIQLLTYLDAVSKNENADSAGALYFSLIEPIMKLKNKYLTAEELEAQIRAQFKMNGLILGNVKVVKMMDNTLTTGSSDIIPAYIDKEGNVATNKPSILVKEDFVALQNKVEKTIKQIAEEMLSGEISQKPIYSLKNKRTACEFCSYQTICGFNHKLQNNDYRYIPNLKKEEILNSLKEK